MKKLFGIKLGLIFSVILGCNQLPRNLDIEYVEVYYIPFSKSSPVHMGDEFIEGVTPWTINNKEVLDQIKTHVLKFQKTSENYKSQEIYLRCKIYNRDGQVYILDYNKNLFRLNGTWYDNDEVLVDKIILSKI